MTVMHRKNLAEWIMYVAIYPFVRIAQFLHYLRRA